MKHHNYDNLQQPSGGDDGGQPHLPISRWPGTRIPLGWRHERRRWRQQVDFPCRLPPQQPRLL
eukprot:5682790-Pyramimonas_sp.AAC.1